MEPLLRFYRQDWYFAIPMTLMSLAAVTLVLWRVILNYSARTSLQQLIPELQEKLQEAGPEAALLWTKTQQGLIARKLLSAGLEVSSHGLAAARRAMANVAELEVLPELNFLLPSILALAKIATMVGLLGTVISMIGTFTEMAALRQSGGDITAASDSIGLALFATALGLITAIPLVFAHVLFKAWIESYDTRMKSAALKLLVMLQAQKVAAGKYVDASAMQLAEPAGLHH